MRIVSLLPSATEIVAALGLAPYLVARSHECDYPPEVRKLPACSAREIELTESTPGIQLRATAPAYRAISIFTVDWDILRGLRPTHILTQSLCGACGVSEEEMHAVLETELFEKPQVLSLEARTLTGVMDEIQKVGGFLGEPARGEALASSLRARIESVAERASSASGEKPVVACLEWLQPFMLGGNWMPEMIRLAGGIPAGGSDGSNSPWIDWPELIAADADLLISMPCGWRLPRALKETRRVAERPEWKRLKAVARDQVYVADGSDFFNRPGPRLVDSLEILAEIVSPRQFPPQHHPAGWVKFPG
jgi:iron complex transport system substrate-binding protein